MYKTFENVIKYPSPEAKASTSPAGGEVISNVINGHRPVNLKDYRIKSGNDTKGIQYGRSMIEMLGVLAIIGVLSVSGIAGYSKAMEKWKVDKWGAQFVQMVTETQTAYVRQKSFSNKVEDITGTLMSIGAIPQGMLDENRFDMLGHKLTVLTRAWDKYGIRLNFYYRLKAGKEAVACCKKLYEIGQSLNGNWIVHNENYYYPVCGKSAPDDYSRAMGCKVYDLVKVSENCKSCETNNCAIIFLVDNVSY